jgi:transposase
MEKKTPSRKESRAWRARRKKAEQMFADGVRQAEIARTLGVSRQCVHNWYWQWQGDDAGSRRSRPGASGRRAKLVAEQLSAVDEALRRGPAAFGFQSERWTLWRCAVIIERVTGVHYHPSSVWRILRALGWTLKLPPKQQRRKKGYNPRHWCAPGKPRISPDGQL